MIQKRSSKLVTVEELAETPGLGPCELVRGKIVPLSPTGRPHTEVLGRINLLVAAHVKKENLGLIAVGEAGFLVHRNPDSVRAPDLAFVSKKTLARFEKVPGTYYPAAPDLAVEVVSPEDRWKDVQEKVAECLGAGAKAVWVASPPEERIYVYEPGERVRVLETADTIAGGEALPGFKARVSAFFTDKKPKKS